MLSIGKLGKGQERYYLGKVAQGAEDYYSGEGEVAGEWIGDAAARLGLEGEVGEDQLVAMLTGRNPATGEPLLGTSGVPASGSVPGFDLTFSAPKSVSLLWGLGGADVAAEVKAAHGEAVGAALAYMQREACWTRRGAGGAEFLRGEGYLAAAYLHRSSRNGDPQLHTHVLVANATKAEGRWTRLYHPAIYDHATTASYLYEAHLRDELSRRLGVEWQQTRKGIAEIEGFADEHLRAFSTRRAEILAAAGENASARSMQVATLATRKPKEADVGQGELRQRWRAKAEEIGLDREEIERTLGVLDPSERDQTLTAHRLDRTVTEDKSHFDRRDAIQAVADSMRNGAQAADIERMADEFLASESVLQIAENAKGPRYTTTRIWELEREALAAVDRMSGERAAVAGGADRCPGDRLAPNPEGRAAPDGPSPARQLRAGGCRDRRGGHRQELRDPRRGRGLGAGRHPLAGRGADLAGCGRPAIRRPGGGKRCHPAHRIRPGQAGGRTRGAGPGIGPCDRRGGDGRLGEAGPLDRARRARPGKARPTRRHRAARRDRGGRPLPGDRRAQQPDPPRTGDSPRAQSRPRGDEADP